VENPEAVSMAQTTLELQPVVEQIRLLLVDDEEHFRRVLNKRLSKRGIVLEEAANGEECLSILEKTPMDVVLLDVKMPGMDGLEVLHQIKRKHKKTEVILLTGYATTQGGVEGIKSGAFDYLSKPIDTEHLVTKIKQAHGKILREEEKERETDFRARMEQRMVAAERLASLGTLAAGVAHEINNPLAIINDSAGWMKLLLKKEETTALSVKSQFEKGLDKIEKSVERARKITHQLLSFVRKNDSIMSEVDLKKLVEEAFELLNKEAKNKGIELAQESDPSLGTIWSDPHQLRQILINLLTNAIYAIGEKGRVTVSLEKKGDEMSLTVRDTGQGIPKENLERIFEPFFSTKSGGEGTGLGLFVTRGIIEKLGGMIEVESQVGRGTSFKIKLPGSLRQEKALKEDTRETVSVEDIRT
jgi:two-component system NtrC family sensor kinase